MKKFNTIDWKEIPHGETFEILGGKVHVRATRPVAVLVENEGGEALAGTGLEIEQTFPGPVAVTVLATDDTDVRVFLFDRETRLPSKRDEVFTNADRMPMESGTLLEVQKSLRAFKLEQRSMLSEMRAERRALEQSRKAAEPAPEPEPAAALEEPEAEEPDAPAAAE